MIVFFSRCKVGQFCTVTNPGKQILFCKVSFQTLVLQAHFVHFLCDCAETSSICYVLQDFALSSTLGNCCTSATFLCSRVERWDYSVSIRWRASTKTSVLSDSDRPVESNKSAVIYRVLDACCASTARRGGVAETGQYRFQCSAVF